jgi:hypothetical protein
MVATDFVYVFRDILPSALAIGIITWVYRVLKSQINELRADLESVKKDKDKWYDKYTALVATLIRTSNKNKCKDCKMLEAFQEHISEEQK